VGPLAGIDISKVSITWKPGRFTSKSLDENQFKYYDKLCSAAAQSQSAYDKTILTLSGGAFGLSLAFLKDVVGSGTILYPRILMLAFACWIFSMVVILISFATGQISHTRAAIEYIADPAEYDFTNAGGIANSLTKLANFISGITCIAGLILVSLFVSQNVGGTQYAKKAFTPATEQRTAEGQGEVVIEPFQGCKEIVEEKERQEKGIKKEVITEE